MRTVETKVYTFEELSDEAKQVALDRHREINAHDGWWDPIYEGLTEKAKEAGFEVQDIYFSGFWSQGDGAMFTYKGFNDNILKGFVAQLQLSEEDKQLILSQGVVSGKGLHRGHYYHEKSCDHYVYLESNDPDFEYATDLIDGLDGAFENYVTEVYEDLCGQLYKDLEEYYNELTSDEYVGEMLIENEYEFTEDGKIF